MGGRWQKFTCQPREFLGAPGTRNLAAPPLFGHPREMTKLLRTRLLVLLALFAPFAVPAADSPTDLLETIKKMDSAIFDAFNAHDADRLMSYFTEDLEFYHDTGGLGNYRQNAEDFKKMFASTPDIRRDLVPESLEVYPIKDYGAMEIGQHRFCHKENGKDDCGTFGFAMVWRRVGDSWKISRVLSYGHKPPK
jgi:ketosteroid isomerase-like protein